MEKISVNTSPAKEVMVQSLIRDVSVEACIYDLIDNAIDAAREILLSEYPEDVDEHGLPLSYEGYWVELTVDKNGLFIKDNCGGMSSESVVESVLRFGMPSSKQSAIGLYGVGLNRAAFKIGQDVKIVSTTASEQVSISFNVPEFLQKEGWMLDGTKSEAVDQPGTIIRLTELTDEALRVLGNQSSVSNIDLEISEIYYKFLQKGFEIKFNGDPVEPNFIEIREDSPFPILSTSFTSPKGIYVEIVAGQHRDHKFSAEPSYKDGCNDNLTPDYGWTISCNDRPVVIRNKESATGWDGPFHNQFYGFVGYARFYSKDGRLLPWNTSKTGVDLPNETYQEALEEMRKFTKKWRSYSDIAKKFNREKKPLLPASAQDNPIVPPEPKPTPGAGVKPPQPVKPKKSWSILPEGVDASKCSDKVQDVVLEAQKINIKNARYTALSLMRTLFEVAALDYLIHKKEIRNLKDQITEEINQEREKSGKEKITKKYGRQRNPKLEEITDYFVKNPHIWGGDKQSYLRESLNAFINRKPILNSALHDPIRKIAIDKVEGIRDELKPILRHLVEYRDNDDGDDE